MIIIIIQSMTYVYNIYIYTEQLSQIHVL